MSNRIMSLLLVLAASTTGISLVAQVPDPQPTPATRPPSPPATTVSPSPSVPSSKPTARGSPLGEEIPFFDPGTEIFSWGGKNWNITNMRIFQARFEKYLNAPEQTGEEHVAYQNMLSTIMTLLSPENTDSRKLSQAFVMLCRAAAYDIDANMCNTLGGAVATALQAQRNQNQITYAVAEIKKEIQVQQSHATMYSAMNNLQSAPSSASPGKPPVSPGGSSGASANEMRTGYALKEAASLQAQVLALTAKREVSAIQARVQFQALILQLFVQRRFQHVVIACQLYRQLFPEGDGSLKLEGQSREFFAKDIGVPPTVSTIQTLATEAMRDAREGVKAYTYLADNSEMESATKRLSESFVVGEYMPELRTLSRERKRLALFFMQKSNRLISALEVRDYAQAESLVKELETMARDFDSTKPRAAIEMAKTLSGMHLAKARNAAIEGDKASFEGELKQAVEAWPLNPALNDFASATFTSGDLQSKTLAELDQLISLGNFRQVFDDKLRFIAASATSPDHQKKLRKLLDDMQTIETALARSEEFTKRGDPAGAWESIERAVQLYPDDLKLNQARGALSTAVAGFVQSLKTAQQLEKQGQDGSSLTWYLDAQRKYPLSEYAREGIDRLVAKLLPGS